MPAYLPYPKKKDTPSRKSRKGSRANVFLANSVMAAKIRKARRAERKAAKAALEEGTEE